MSHQNEHPEIAEHTWIDDTFRVTQTRWKTWRSYSKDGSELITSLTEEQCIVATRFYMKGLQEGFPEAKAHEGTVGGKL
jgi:hypothetical protein